jgi:hypothetical protein
VTKAPKDIGASVRARLLQLAKKQGEDFQLVLTRYANERLLYRLARSSHSTSFVLKGAALFLLGRTSLTARPETSIFSGLAIRVSIAYVRFSRISSRSRWTTTG